MACNVTPVNCNQWLQVNAGVWKTIELEMKLLHFEPYHLKGRCVC